MRKIIHIDMDAFFASVEQRDRPELRGRPVIVGGSPQHRGVVATCSYEARGFGIHSAMPTCTALRLCPHAELLSPDIRKYREASRRVRKIFFSVTSRVEPVSIDEAYLDVTENALKIPFATKVAKYILREIFVATKLTASAGVSYNKFLAKMASDCRKPAGLTVITPEKAQAFLDALPVARFHGVGKVTAARFAAMNIRFGRDLRRLELPVLRNLFGRSGEYYYQIVRGVDERPVEPESEPKSISREVTLYEDCSDLRRIRIILRTLARKVARRAAARGVAGESVTLKLKYGDFRTVTRQLMLPRPLADGAAIGEHAVALLRKTEAGSRPVRLIGVGVGNLVPPKTSAEEQLEFEFK